MGDTLIKTALLGGSFNPFHNGHAAMSQVILRDNLADEVWLLPAKKPPHKPSWGYAPNEDRLAMLNAYAERNDKISVCDIELKLEGITYTAKTLEKLTELYPDRKFSFVLGGDSIVNFHKWFKPEIIVKLADIIIFTRDETDKKCIKEIIKDLKKSIGGNYIIADAENVDVSSSVIRINIKAGEDITRFVPKEIAEYIAEKGLYKEDDSEYDLEYFKSEMKNVLKPKRYKHSLGVMETSVKLAEIYGVDTTKAAVAGILHDNAKHFSAAELLNLCIQNNIDVKDSEKVDKKTIKSLLHSKAGAILAKNLYKVTDEDIINAIYYHTVGRPAMTRLEEIVFVADFIEPNRTHDSVPPLSELRIIAEKDLDRAVYLICESTIDHLASLDSPINENTLLTRDYYRKYTGESL